MPAGLALLLGSPEPAATVFDAAGARLRAEFRVIGESTAVCQDSTVPGDPLRYLNQVFLIADPAPSLATTAAAANDSGDGMSTRRALRHRLKVLEGELGRTPGQAPPVVDIDLLCRFAAGGQVRWQDADKLRHPLFRSLLASALPGWPG